MGNGNNNQPPCGTVGPFNTGFLGTGIGGSGMAGTVWAIILGALGLMGGIIGANLSALAGNKPVFPFSLLNWSYELNIFGIGSISVATLAIFIVAAVAMVLIIGAFYYDRCLHTPSGSTECAAGVIDSIEDSFSSASDQIFPFTAMHNKVDVVVKSAYWNLVLFPGVTDFVACSSDPGDSPELQCLFYNPAVCGAGLGSTIGGVVGAVAGVVAAAAAAAAIGCATVILCIVGIIVGVLIVVVAALVGAFAGGQAGKAIASSSVPTSDTNQTLNVGDYVTIKGNLVPGSGDFKGANVFWFATDAAQHGRSMGSPEFSFKDPDQNFIQDGCSS